jgi:hypothetical protein
MFLEEQSGDVVGGEDRIIGGWGDGRVKQNKIK